MQEQSISEDSRLIALIRNGDKHYFAEIIKKYQSTILSYLYRLTGSREVSQDLAQDSFLSAYQAIIKDNADITLKPWLFRIATNNAWKYYRRRKIISFTPFEDILDIGLPESEATARDIERKLTIERALLKVPPDQRTCMLLHFVEGFKYSDVAAIVGISEEAVRKRIARGSRKFQESYKQEVSP